MRPVSHDSTLLISVPPADGLDSVEDEYVVDVEHQDAADVDLILIQIMTAKSPKFSHKVN